MDLNAREWEVVVDTDFLKAKADVLKKSWHLLEQVRDRIRDNWDHENYTYPTDLILHSGKISRGENYQMMPYQMLDFPALFKKDDIFAFRTMFWWGHYFSLTFHLQGEFLKTYRDRLLEALPALVEKQFWICVGDTPWQYDFVPENYEVLTEGHRGLIRDCSFLKISRKVELIQWDNLPNLAEVFSRDIMESISIE